MALFLTLICSALVLGLALLLERRRHRIEWERYSISPEDLHGLLESDKNLMVLDVRLPLDLLSNSTIIPGATWLAPSEVITNPAVIPRDKDLVVYCTCESDKTSRAVLRRSLALGFQRIKFLRGGLQGWRAKGFPVEPYLKPFHLETGMDIPPIGAASTAPSDQPDR